MSAGITLDCMNWTYLDGRDQVEAMDDRGRVYFAPDDLYDEDVMAQADTISIEELEPREKSQMEVAGLDDLTPVDTFIQMNGDARYVTEM